MELKNLVIASVAIAFVIVIRLAVRQIQSINTDPTTSDNTTFDEADIYHS